MLGGKRNIRIDLMISMTTKAGTLTRIIKKGKAIRLVTTIPEAVGQLKPF